MALFLRDFLGSQCRAASDNPRPTAEYSKSRRRKALEGVSSAGESGRYGRTSWIMMIAAISIRRSSNRAGREERSVKGVAAVTVR
jgi:hypothetical protein